MGHVLGLIDVLFIWND